MAILLNENNEIINPIIESVLSGEYEYSAALSEDTEVLFNSPESSFSHLVAIKKGYNLIRFELQDAAPDKCVVSNNIIVYPEAFEDVDIYYTLSPGEIKEDIMLNSAYAPTTFTFTLESEGVTAEPQADRSINYVDNLSGEYVWSIQAPYAIDANNADVPVELVYGEGLYSLTVATDESTVYPVRLDPTIAIVGSYGYLGLRPAVKDSLGRWYAVYTKKTGQLGVYRSNNLSTWTEITGHIMTGYNYQEYASLAADNSGNIHMAWTGNDAGFSTHKAKYRKYDGTSWTSWINLDNIPSGHYAYVPSINIDGNGVIHVIYGSTDPDSEGKYLIKYCRSSDGGTTWTPFVNIWKVAYDQWNSSLAIGKDNTLHVAWHGQGDLNPNRNQIWYSTSVDSGTTWSAPLRVTDEPAYQVTPCIVVDNNDKPYIFWSGVPFEGAPDESIAYSSYDGTAWTAWENINRNPGYTQFKPSVNVDPQGNMYVVFYGKTPANTTRDAVYYSKHDGSSWSPWETKSGWPTINVIGAALPAKFDYTMPIVYANSSYGVAEVITTEYVEPPSGIEDTADFDLIRCTAVSLPADMDTYRSITRSDEPVVDTKRGLTLSHSTLSDTRRAISVSHTALTDTKRVIGIADNTLTDTRRPVNVSRSALTDTKRPVLVTSSSALDTHRQIQVTASATTDSMRRLLRECATLRDTKRRTQVTSSSSHDTTRILEAFLVTVQLVCDATRRVATAADANHDSIRRIEAAISAEMDVARRLAVSDTTYNDTLRTLTPFLMALEASFDTSRKLTVEDEALMDTLRRAYGIVGDGTVELTMSFLADVMGVLRLQY